MTVKFDRPGQGASEEAIRALEAEVGMRVPSEYRRFLVDHDGGTPESNEFLVPGPAGSSGVNEFLSVRQVIEERRALGTRLPAPVIPIAYAECGNLVCLRLPEGNVLYWDHELEDADPFIELSPDFISFWQGVTKLNVSDVQLRPGQVKSVWVDPDLFKNQQ